MKITKLKIIIHHDDLTSPDKGGDVLDSLQVGGLLGIGEGLLLEGLGVVT